MNKIQQFCRSAAGKITDFWKSLNISAGEVIYLALTYFLLLAISYFLFAMHGFSLSYSKTWPPISCVGDTAYFYLLLLCGHFLCKRSPWYCWSLVTIHFTVLMILLAIYLTTGTFFCESILYLVYDTTIAETKDFFSAYVSIKSVIILLAVISGYFVPMHFARRLYKKPEHYSKADIRAVLLLLLLGIPAHITVIKNSFTEKQWDYAITYYRNTHPFSAIYEHIRIFNQHAGLFTVEMRRRTPPDYVSLQPDVAKNPPVGILVIGESAIRSHHSIYGYERNTTPRLMAEINNIATFNDMISVLPMTITALKYWLTDMTLENRHVKWTVFDALKKSGYKIDIITNQNKSGWADSPLQMIFSTADSITYMHEENYSDLFEDRNAEIYDGKMLPVVKKHLAGLPGKNDAAQPHLLVIHLFGSHDPFRSRYPENYTREFLDDTSQPALVNEYDTSIHYSDMVLGEIISELKSLNRPAYMIYFSDHGSVCKKNNLRTPGSVENSAYEIPFFIWTNEKYRTVIPETWQRIQNSRDLPLQADKAHFGLLEMMGLSFQKDVDEQNFLSDKFKNSPRSVREGQQPYVKDQSESSDRDKNN